VLIAIIAAMDRNRLIGDGGRLPWRLAADMRRFRTLTMGNPVIMGRRTHESIGKVLPGRSNIVLSRNTGYRAPGCVVVADLERALGLCDDADTPMVIGGAQIYAQALARAHRMYLTLLDGSFQGDTWFPEYDHRPWREISREDHARDADSPCAFSFVDLEKAQPARCSGFGKER
jgi:dihydrofolate reductase